MKLLATLLVCCLAAAVCGADAPSSQPAPAVAPTTRNNSPDDSTDAAARLKLLKENEQLKKEVARLQQENQRLLAGAQPQPAPKTVYRILPGVVFASPLRGQAVQFSRMWVVHVLGDDEAVIDGMGMLANDAGIGRVWLVKGMNFKGEKEREEIPVKEIPLLVVTGEKRLPDWPPGKDIKFEQHLFTVLEPVKPGP